MGEIRRKKGKVSWAAVENFVATPDFVLTFQSMDRFVLPVVDMQRRTAMRRDPNDKIIECPTSIIASNLENEISAGARLEDQSLTSGYSLGLVR